MSAAILSVPGTSKCFVGSVAAYSLSSRTALLGWTPEDTAKYEYAHRISALPASVLRGALGSTWCLGESGATGPTRPDAYRASISGPGYCAFGLVHEKGESWGSEVDIPQPKTRDENMVAFAEKGLQFLLDRLEK